jgi:hypothetical protein
VSSRRTELVLELVEKWNSGGVEAYLEALGPEFEFTPDPSFPDTGSYAGEDLRRWLREWTATWEGNQLEVLGITDHGRAVTLDSRWHLAAKQTGDEIPNRDFTLVIWFDAQDRPLRMAAFFDRDRAAHEAQRELG